jgi:hypothetical protein
MELDVEMPETSIQEVNKRAWQAMAGLRAEASKLAGAGERLHRDMLVLCSYACTNMKSTFCHPLLILRRRMNSWFTVYASRLTLKVTTTGRRSLARMLLDDGIH